MSLTDKIKGRIRKMIETGVHQSRVYFSESGMIVSPAPCWGVYKLKHHVHNLPFHVDSKGRITLYEG